MVNIAPILHYGSGLKKSLLQLTGLLAGVGTIFVLHWPGSTVIGLLPAGCPTPPYSELPEVIPPVA